MVILFYIFIFILGACLGSFLCCQVRRLHRHPESTRRSRKNTQRPKQKTSKTLKSKNLPAYSVCLSCKAKLKWYDNIPIISWLVLRGKCRKCHTKIGLAELLSEIFTALSLLFLSIAFLSPYITSMEFFPTNITVLSWAIYITAIILTLFMIFLAIYDALYRELPVFALVISAFLAVAIFILKICQHLSIRPFSIGIIVDPLLAVLILGGLYLVLYLISKGKWIGDGDYLLGAIIGLTLGTPWLALVALFLANLTATLVMYPTLKGRNKRKQKIPFGPFLVTALVLTLTFADLLTSLI